MTTTATQNNFYHLFDSMGRPTDIYYVASNLKEAFKMFKEDKENYSVYYYGKLKRGYNGGVRG